MRFKRDPKQAQQQASGRTRCRENKKWLSGVTLACLEVALGGEQEAAVAVSVCGLLGRPHPQTEVLLLNLWPWPSIRSGQLYSIGSK